jgi:hypothetical protein
VSAADGDGVCSPLYRPDHVVLLSQVNCIPPIRQKRRRYMDRLDELSRRELLVLKEIHLMGRTTDPIIALQLFNDDMLIDSQDCCLQLTAKGRRLLVRGSPSLWD